MYINLAHHRTLAAYNLIMVVKGIYSTPPRPHTKTQRASTKGQTPGLWPKTLAQPNPMLTTSHRKGSSESQPQSSW